MHKLASLVLLSIFISCSSKSEQTYECEDTNANLRLFVHTLYPGEKLELYFNNIRFYQGGTDTGKYYFERWFCLPLEDTLTIELKTIYNGRIILEHTESTIFKDGTQYEIFTGPPYPKKMKYITFPRDWGYVPIDSSKREIVFKENAEWPAKDY